ncbi:MAG TPA: hypothetical protein VNI79_00975 [Sphingomicrobium sp.]|nr:hypothetical protein [Sphingomicrobium sp.]
MAEIKRLSPHYRAGPLPHRTNAAYQALRRDIPKLNDEQVYARMSQVIGTLDANHTMFRRLPGTEVQSDFERYLPVKFYVFPEGVFIVDAEPGHEDLIGKRLLSIGRTPADEAFRKVASALSIGHDMEAYWIAPTRMTEVHLLHGLGIVPATEAVTLSLAGADGTVISRVLRTDSNDTLSKLMAPRGVPTPLFLKRVPESHWFEAWPDKSTVYVQFNQVIDDKDETLPQFRLRLRRELDQRPVKNLILDLRHNNGGNTFNYAELMRTAIAFSAKEGNQLYVLIGRNVYSAAANFTTDIERLGNPIFVGELTGNTGNQEGDEGQILLPYSGWRASVGAVWWQLSSPWDKRRGIPPHVPVQLTAKAYFAGEDPVLDTVGKLIAQRS